jgi:hypothetical protein
VEQLRLVVQGRDVAQVDSRHGQGSARRECAHRDRYELARRCEQDGTVERLRRCPGGRPDRVDAERPRELMVELPAREDVHPKPEVERQLRREVGAPSEPVEPERASGWDLGSQQRPVADDACAQQRRGLLVGEAVGQRVGERLVDQAEVGVSAVDVPPRERRCDAQVLVAPAARRTPAVCAGEPRHADPVTDGEPPR